MTSSVNLKLVVLLLLCELTVSNLTNRNVIFQKITERSTTKSSWKLTLVASMTPYVAVFQKLYKTLSDIDNSLNLVLSDSGAIKLHDSSDNPGLVLNFLRLNVEINDLSKSLNEVRDNFLENLTLKKNRTKRSLIPFVGDALSFLFGTVSNTDLTNIRFNIKKLAGNQKQIAHVVAESLTIVNSTRVEVSENRQTINKLLADVGKLDNKLLNITQVLENRILDLEEMIQVYLQIDLALEEFKRSFSEFSDQIERFHLKLNMLAIGKLTPSLITPAKLQSLLLEIQNQLPFSLKLPADLRAELWNFYRVLTCETHIDDENIITIITIPLLNTNYELDIFKIHNLPIPYRTDNDSRAYTLVAQYELETTYIAVDKHRTRVVLLSESESQICTKEHLGFCPIQSPIYSISTSRSCVMALFMRNDEKISKYCKTVISTNTMLPIANYLQKGLWVVTTHKIIRFNVNCREPKSSSEVIIKPPIDFIELSMSCMAHSEIITLTPYYHQSSRNNLILKLPTFITNYNDTQNILWSPIKRKFPNLSHAKLPPKLKSMNKIPIDNFIQELSDLSPIQDMAPPKWSFALSGLLILPIVFGVVVFVRRKMKSKMIKVTESSKGDDLELTPLRVVKTIGCDKANGDCEMTPSELRGSEEDRVEVNNNPGQINLYPDLKTNTRI